MSNITRSLSALYTGDHHRPLWSLGLWSYVMTVAMTKFDRDVVMLTGAASEAGCRSTQQWWRRAAAARSCSDCVGRPLIRRCQFCCSISHSHQVWCQIITHSTQQLYIMYGTIRISWHLQLRTGRLEDFVGAVLLPLALPTALMETVKTVAFHKWLRVGGSI